LSGEVAHPFLYGSKAYLPRVPKPKGRKKGEGMEELV